MKESTVHVLRDFKTYYNEIWGYNDLMLQIGIIFSISKQRRML